MSRLENFRGIDDVPFEGLDKPQLRELHSARLQAERLEYLADQSRGLRRLWLSARAAVLRWLDGS